MSNPPSVLVVGAGPTGLTLALELVRRGVATRVIDRAVTPHEQSRAMGLNGRSLEILDDLRLIESAIDSGHEVHGVNVYSGGDRVVHVGFEDVDRPFPFNLVLPQGRTERLLLKELERLGGKVERGLELISLAQDEGGRWTTATLARAGGLREELRVPWLVGCDGAQSTVRSALGLALENAREQTFLVADVIAACALPRDEAHVFQAPGGLALLTPSLGEGHYRLILDNPPRGAPDPPSRDILQRLVNERAHDVAIERVVWSARFQRQVGATARFRAGRVFLAGDAAHTHGAFGDPGLNLGIQDAYNLGWKLALVVNGAGRPEILDSYDPERRGASTPTRVASDAVMRAVTLRHPVSRDLRDRIAGFLLALDAVRRRLVGSAPGVDLKYARSPIAGEHRSPLRHAPLLPDRTTEAPSVRDWLDFGAAPGPGDHVPDVPIEGKRLYDLLRGLRHTLLLFDGGAHTPAGYRNLCDIAERARQRAGEHIAIHLIVPREARPPEIADHESVLLDDEGALHRRFGAGSECLYLVRPDGYVGFRAQPAAWEPLAAHLDLVFNARGQESSAAPT